MKTLKSLKIALILTTLLTTPVALAGNCDGGSCTGGGNVLKDFLISDYAVGTDELPHFEATEPYLKALEERVPEFGQKIRSFTNAKPEDVNGVQWYLIPAYARELPESVTHLHFQTDQPLYQQGKEIFVSEPDTTGRSPELMGRVYLQDLLEMAHPTKDPESVRKMMVYLKRTNYAPPQDVLVDMLQKLGFGKFDTKQRAEEKAKVLGEFQQKRMEKFFKDSEYACTLQIAAGYVFVVQKAYMNAFGTSTISGKDGKDGLDPKFAPDLREYMIKYRNEMLKNDHLASLHAASLLPSEKASVKMNVKKVITAQKPEKEDRDLSDEEVAAYWYAGYPNRLAIEGDASDVKSTLSPEVIEKISKYEKKYKDNWRGDNFAQACRDLKAFKKDLESASAAKAGGDQSNQETKGAGETGAQ